VFPERGRAQDATGTMQNQNHFWNWTCTITSA
jgi:hypothetical protein